MSVTYNYDEPVGGATLMQVSYYSGEQSKTVEFDAVFVDGKYDAEATELVVAAKADTIFDEPTPEPSTDEPPA